MPNPYSRSGASTNPFDRQDGTNPSDYIIVNSDIMILPDQQGSSQSEEDDLPNPDSGRTSRKKQDPSTSSSTLPQKRSGKSTRPSQAPPVPDRGSLTAADYLAQLQEDSTTVNTVKRTHSSGRIPSTGPEPPSSPTSPTSDLEMQDRSRLRTGHRRTRSPPSISPPPLSPTSSSRSKPSFSSSSPSVPVPAPSPTAVDTATKQETRGSPSSASTINIGRPLEIGKRSTSVRREREDTPTKVTRKASASGANDHGQGADASNTRNGRTGAAVPHHQHHPTRTPTNAQTHNKVAHAANASLPASATIMINPRKSSKRASSRGFPFEGLFSSKATKASAMDSPTNQSRSGSKNNLIDGTNPYPFNNHPLATDMAEKPRSSAPHRRTGVPGKNGEQPETDLFEFVDVMLDMPEDSTWGMVIWKMVKVLAIMTISYFALMSLYFGAEFQAETHLSNFKIMVVDLDQGLIGSNFLNFTRQLNMEPVHVNWSIETQFNNMTLIRQQINDGQYWGAVVVQPNASSNLLAALANSHADYDPTSAFAFVYDGGRNPLVVKPYVVANMYTSFLMFTKVFNPNWILYCLNVADNYNITLSPLKTSPQVLGTPVAFQEFDLHPITAPIITSATSVAYIWIFIVAGGSTYLVAHMVQPLTKYSSVPKTMAVLLLPLSCFLIVLSMAYTLLLLTFGVPFQSVVQFIYVFAGMFFLQASVASMVLALLYLIPVVFIPSITITYVIMNVIAVFNPTELIPGFYKWVYAMPFLNAVQVARFVLMGSYNRLVYNLPILAAWVLVPIVCLPFAIARQKREQAVVERRAAAAALDVKVAEGDSGHLYQAHQTDDDEE